MMYEFRPVTKRINQMRQLVRDRVIAVDAQRVELITGAYQKYHKVPPSIKTALVTHEICTKMTTRVEDFELIVGNIGKAFLGSGMWPEWDASWLWNELEDKALWEYWDDGLYHRTDKSGVHLSMSEDEIKRFMSYQDFWKDKTITQYFDSWGPDGFEEVAGLGILEMGEKMRAPIHTGHLVAGYEKIINKGYGRIRSEAKHWIDAHKGNLMGDDVEKYMFYKSAVIVCDAATGMIKNYAKACALKAKDCPDASRKAELKKMADGLLWLSENPARTFWEACQGVILYQVLLYMEARHPALAFGRFDQYTWPFLEADLKENRLTLEAAQEIVDAFFLKSNCFYRASNPRIAAYTGVGVTYHHTTIGGVNKITGDDASNPVTYVVLETLARLSLHDPTVSLRIHKDTPEKLWDLAIETTRRVGGLPLFQNDAIIIPGLVKELNMTLEDARDYSIIGCQEIVGSGNDYPAGNGLHGKAGLGSHGNVLLTALNNGTNPSNGKSGGLETGYLYEMKSFDEVKAAYKKQFDYLHKWSVTIQNYVENLSEFYAPSPALSISIEGCMASGKDCAAGGAKYNSYGGTATGLATVSDSLMAIKYMVFDQEICTAKELYDAMMADWKGYEVLQQQILNEVPHYGNDDNDADEMMRWVTDIYYDNCKECYSKRSKVYKAGLYGAAQHVVQGAVTDATPDGRNAGQPLADAMSPGQGRDKNGPTAIYNSACHIDHGKYMDGIALNLKVHPSSLQTQGAKKALLNMTKAYFEKGGMEVQYNVVSTEAMRAAQKDPAAYRDLVVRIAGYSAYFNELSEAMQNDVISRNEVEV